MDEALLVDVLAVYALGRQLAEEGASEEMWHRYREQRNRVLSAVDVRAAA